MAMTVNRSGRGYVGDRRRTFGTLTLDTSYPTNGYAFTIPTLELQKLDMMTVLPASGFVFEVDYTNSKVKAFWGDNAGGASGPLIEVTNGTNVSAAVPRWEAWGV
jgi:hypothetical protein